MSSLLNTGNIVQDCLKFFRLLPIGYLIYIRTARFLEDFIINENYVCILFVRNAECSLDKIFSMYSDNIQVVSTRNLRNVISDMWFG